MFQKPVSSKSNHQITRSHIAYGPYGSIWWYITHSTYIYIYSIYIYHFIYIYIHTLYIYISCLSNKLKLLKALLSKHSQAVQPGDSSKVSPNCCSACFAATRMESWAPQTRLGGKDRRSHKGERLVNDWWTIGERLNKLLRASFSIGIFRHHSNSWNRHLARKQTLQHGDLGPAMIKLCKLKLDTVWKDVKHGATHEKHFPSHVLLKHTSTDPQLLTCRACELVTSYSWYTAYQGILLSLQVHLRLCIFLSAERFFSPGNTTEGTWSCRTGRGPPLYNGRQFPSTHWEHRSARYRFPDSTSMCYKHSLQIDAKFNHTVSNSNQVN